MHIPLVYEHLFYKYFVRRSVGQATKGKRASLLWILSSLLDSLIPFSITGCQWLNICRWWCNVCKYIISVGTAQQCSQLFIFFLQWNQQITQHKGWGIYDKKILSWILKKLAKIGYGRNKFGAKFWFGRFFLVCKSTHMYIQ